MSRFKEILDRTLFYIYRLTVFWNNQESGRKVITSSSVVGVPGTFRREMNTHNCPEHMDVQNSASCYLPSNNGHIMVWEEGTKLSGYLVKDGAFNPVLGTQRKAKVLYNSRQNRAFVVYQQTVNGRRLLYVKNIAPGSQASCSTPCKTSERCAMKDVCTPRNSGIVDFQISGTGCTKGGWRYPSDSDFFKLSKILYFLV